MKAIAALKLAVCLLALAGCNAVADTGATDVSAGIKEFAQGVQPGCALGVFAPSSQPRYMQSGYADIAARIPITRNTQFLAASMSKQFTALAVLHLAAEGRLKLQDSARTWVPEFARAVQDATIEQLLHQTAGVRDHTTLLMLSGIEVLSSVDRAQTLALLARQNNTNFPPGTRAQYSNGNYLVLSEIVARASGLPQERYAARVIFEPLKMENTQFLSERKPVALAQGYRPNDAGTGFEVANDRPATNGSGGLITTVSDLQKFDADFRAERVVWRPEIKRQMLTPGRLNDGTIAILPEFGTPYSMGLAIAEEEGDVRVFHDGGAEGFRAEYTRLLKRNAGVAVLCNRVDARAPAIADAALRVAAKVPPRSAPKRTDTSKASLGVPPQTLLEAVSGGYDAEELGARFTFSARTEALEVSIASPLTRAPVVETWGGLRLAEDGSIRSGPIRLVLVRKGAGVAEILLSFGNRVDGIVLRRTQPG